MRQETCNRRCETGEGEIGEGEIGEGEIGEGETRDVRQTTLDRRRETGNVRQEA